MFYCVHVCLKVEMECEFLTLELVVIIIWSHSPLIDVCFLWTFHHTTDFLCGDLGLLGCELQLNALETCDVPVNGYCFEFLICHELFVFMTEVHRMTFSPFKAQSVGLGWLDWTMLRITEIYFSWHTDNGNAKYNKSHVFDVDAGLVDQVWEHIL